MQQELPLNNLQKRLLSLPEELDVFVGGGRGGGKSFGLANLALRHAIKYEKRARVLYLRQTYRGLADFELTTRDLFTTVCGTDARYNAAEHVWRLPGDGYVELGQLESAADYAKYQGRSFTLLLVDEAGQYGDPQLLDLLRSNLRGPRDLPIRVVMAGNPGGPGQAWLSARYVFRAAPWTAFFEEKSKRDWVYAPSVFAENEFLDREQYASQLEAACAENPELLRAWTTGDWSANVGAYFADCLDEGRNACDPWERIPEWWDTYLAHDFGSAAPSVTFVCARSPGDELGGRFYPRNSIVLVDELAAVRRGQLNAGLNWTAARTAEGIKEMCARWKIDAHGVGDDSMWAKTGHSTGSIADEFRSHGVHFEPAKKGGRVAGWQIMRRLLIDAGRVDRPGLYISRACRYFWQTVPQISRDMKHIEDVDSDSPDHAADAARYACMAQQWAKSIDIGIAH